MKSCMSCMLKEEGICKSQGRFCKNYVNQFEENEDVIIERYINNGRENYYKEFYEYLVENNGEQDLFY